MPCGHDPIIPKSPYDHVLLVVQNARCVLPSQRYSIVAVKTKAVLLCRSPSSSCNFIGQAGCKMSVWRSADLGRFVDGWGTDSGTSIWFSQAVPHRRSALRSRDPPSSASRACAKDWGTHHANKWHIQAYPIHCLLNSVETCSRNLSGIDFWMQFWEVEPHNFPYFANLDLPWIRRFLVLHELPVWTKGPEMFLQFTHQFSSHPA